MEIAAPGVEVLSTLPGDAYASWGGTSMATPHVAGVAALVWSYSAHQIRRILAATAMDLGAGGCDNEFGHGMIQAKAAKDMLVVHGCAPADQMSLLDGDNMFDDALCTPSGSDAVCNAYWHDPDLLCPNGQETVSVDIFTDNYPSETSWKVKDCGNGIVAGRKGDTKNEGKREMVSRQVSVCMGRSYAFTIEDSYGGTYLF